MGWGGVALRSVVAVRGAQLQAARWMQAGGKRGKPVLPLGSCGRGLNTASAPRQAAGARTMGAAGQLGQALLHSPHSPAWQVPALPSSAVQAVPLD